MTRLFPLLAALLLALPASAASRVDTLLARGEALTARGDPSCSTPLEAASFAAEPSDADYARALGALGLCHEVQARYGEAHRLVSRALEGAPAETTAPGKRAPWPALRAALRRLDDRVARVLVDFPGDLWIDGHAVIAVSGAVLAVDPGRRLFEAREKGRVVAAKEVEARAGDLPSVDLRAQKLTAPPIGAPKVDEHVPSTAPQSPFAPALSPRGVAVTVAYVGLGTAIVSGFLSGVLEAQRSALAARLPDGACVDARAAGCAELRLAFEQSRGARNVALVAGGVAVLGGGVAVGLWLGTERTPASAGITWSGAW